MPIPLGVLAVAGAGAAGGGAAFELLSTTTLTTATSSVTISDISQNYQHLQIRVNAYASTSTGTRPLRIQFNGDTNTANYRSHELANSGTSVISSYTTGSILAAYQNWGNMGWPSIIDILDYKTAKNKVVRFLHGTYDTSILIRYGSGLWQSTSAITSIKIEQHTGYSMEAGTRISIYGIKAA